MTDNDSELTFGVQYKGRHRKIDGNTLNLLPATNDEERSCRDAHKTTMTLDLVAKTTDEVRSGNKYEIKHKKLL